MALARACDDIARRHNQEEPLDCSACGRGLSGIGELWAHIQREHGISGLPSYENLIDIDAFLPLLKRLCNRELTITSQALAECFVTAAADDDAEDADETGHGAFADDEDDEFDEGFPVQCLYCDNVTTTVEEHLANAHGFNLRSSAVFNKTVCPDEYDRVRMVNAIRRAVQENRCPNAECNVRCSSSAELTSHVESTGHFTPSVCPQGDEWLVPVLRGDAMTALVLGIDDDEQDYPMVPTAGEVIRQQRQQECENYERDEDE
jgi:hypothetical protein